MSNLNKEPCSSCGDKTDTHLTKIKMQYFVGSEMEKVEIYGRLCAHCLNIVKEIMKLKEIKQ
jgi:hypothetical protein